MVIKYCRFLIKCRKLISVKNGEKGPLQILKPCFHFSDSLNCVKL